MKFLKKLFSQPTAENNKPTSIYEALTPEEEEKKLQIATCALFIEMAKADSDFSPEEKEKIASIMKHTYNIEDSSIEEIFQLSEKKAQESQNVFELSSIINEHFTEEKKLKLLRNLWRLTYADDNLDLTEDYLIRKIGSTLNIDNETILAAKNEVDEKIKKQAEKGSKL
jgi:uncharacterized tellurite resistance protein B-like protein